MGGLYKIVFDSPLSMDALILHKDTVWSPYRYNKLLVTAKVSFPSNRSLFEIQGDNYTWSDCTNAANGDPYRISGYRLRFPFDNAPPLTEIELAFNDPKSVGQFTELEFETQGKSLGILVIKFKVTLIFSLFK